MKKLKIILLFSLIIYVYIITSNFIYKTSLTVGQTKLSGVIQNIIINGNKLSLVIKSSERLLVTYYIDTKEELDSLDYELGDNVEIDGELVKTSSNTLFNQFSYRKYLMSQKIYFILKAEKITKINDNKNVFYSIKNKLILRMEKLNSSTYLKAFILGDTSEIEDNVVTTYQENGMSHLLAISGMNITFFADILLFFLNKIFKKGNHFFVSLFILFYAFLTNFTPSVIRAVAFFILSKIKIPKAELLILIAGGMLVYNPYYIYNVGFIFSFVISFFLIIFNDNINQYKNYFVKLFMMSLVCFLASLPILINNFFYINIMSPLLNVFFVPFVSLIIFPLSLLTLLFPFLDNLFVFFSNSLEYLSNAASFLNINLTMCHIPFYLVVLYYIVIVLSIKNKKNFLILIVLITFHTNIKYFNKTNYLTMLDVGQGDSLLLELGSNSILIDTGGIANYNTEEWKVNNYSLAIKKTIPYLKSLGIKNLDYLIITHGDYDHIGEAINLINNFKVKKVFINSGLNNSLEENLIKELNLKNIDYEAISEKEINFKNYTFQFLNDQDSSNENEDSIIIYTSISNRKLLLMGDAGRSSEKYVMNKYDLKNIDILKVGHHGSKNSSSYEFIKATNPKAALISVGLNNRFKHPSEDTIKTLEANKIKTYLTSLDGSIKIDLDQFVFYVCSN